MKLYEHITEGGAEYYSTTFTETPGGKKEGTFDGVVLRTDGDELEISGYEQLRRAGFNSVVLPDGTTVDLTAIK